MNLKHRLLVVPALLTVSALTLSGCGGGAGADSTQGDAPVGPISQRAAALGDQFDQASMSIVSAKLEDAVAACMKEQGFDYTPRTWDTSGLTQSTGVPAWDSLEFAKTYGYGITTWEDIPGVSKASDAPPSGDDAESTQPGYQDALWGPGYDPTAGGQPGGCYGKALDETAGKALVDSTVPRDVANLQQQVDEDDRVVAALARWSDCMGGKGYDYKTPTEAQTSIANRAYSSPDGLAGAQLTALRNEEISTAVADYGCSTDLRKIRATVLAGLETDYYAKHKTEVDDYFDQVDKYLNGD